MLIQTLLCKCNKDLQEPPVGHCLGQDSVTLYLHTFMYCTCFFALTRSANDIELSVPVSFLEWRSLHQNISIIVCFGYICKWDRCMSALYVVLRNAVGASLAHYSSRITCLGKALVGSTTKCTFPSRLFAGLVNKTRTKATVFRPCPFVFQSLPSWSTQSVSFGSQDENLTDRWLSLMDHRDHPGVDKESFDTPLGKWSGLKDKDLCERTIGSWASHSKVNLPRCNTSQYHSLSLGPPLQL